MNNRLHGAVCVVLGISLLTLGLWPFNFFPRNRVSWLLERPGVLFDWDGIVYTSEPFSLLQPQHATDNPAITVELWLRPDPRHFSSYADILAFYQPGYPGSFAIGEFGPILHINGTYHSLHGAAGSKGVSVPDIFQPGETRFVTVAASSTGTFVYLQGKPVASYPGVAPVVESLKGQLVLGHAPTRYHPWSGELHGLAIYNRTLSSAEVLENYRSWQDGSYAVLGKTPGGVLLCPLNDGQGSRITSLAGQGGGLVIPRLFTPLERIFLELPTKKDLDDFQDNLLNVAGFIPFGLLLTAYFRKAKQSPPRSAVLAVIIGFVTSLAIELLQGYLPTRTSSLTDLMNNTGGTLIGSLVAAAPIRLIHGRDPRKDNR